MNTTLRSLLTTVLVIIPPSAAIRVIICLLQANTDPEQAPIYHRRAKNAIIFAIIAECAVGILNLAYAYFT